MVALVAAFPSSYLESQCWKRCFLAPHDTPNEICCLRTLVKMWVLSHHTKFVQDYREHVCCHYFACLLLLSLLGWLCQGPPAKTLIRNHEKLSCSLGSAFQWKRILRNCLVTIFLLLGWLLSLEVHLLRACLSNSWYFARFPEGLALCRFGLSFSTALAPFCVAFPLFTYFSSV